jgi:hypothetical protein
MTTRSWLILGVVWLISLVAVGTVVSAQAPFWRPVPTPKVLFGDDVGFRVEGVRGEMPTGVIVIQLTADLQPPHQEVDSESASVVSRFPDVGVLEPALGFGVE